MLAWSHIFVRYLIRHATSGLICPFPHREPALLLSQAAAAGCGLFLLFSYYSIYNMYGRALFVLLGLLKLMLESVDG